MKTRHQTQFGSALQNKNTRRVGECDPRELSRQLSLEQHTRLLWPKFLCAGGGSKTNGWSFWKQSSFQTKPTCQLPWPPPGEATWGKVTLVALV